MRKAKQATLLSACLILGCAAPSQDAKLHSAPVLVIATTADPDALFPPVALNSQSSQITELIYEYLADVGPSMNTIGDAGFTKELATGWTWSSDSL